MKFHLFLLGLYAFCTYKIKYFSRPICPCKSSVIWLCKKLCRYYTVTMPIDIHFHKKTLQKIRFFPQGALRHNFQLCARSPREIELLSAQFLVPSSYGCLLTPNSEPCIFMQKKERPLLDVFIISLYFLANLFYKLFCIFRSQILINHASHKIPRQIIFIPPVVS